jgi:Zn-dependent protease with chaperone function/uncharacterized RDD family membrane protein YckC
VRDPLLSGSESLRHPSERTALIACIVALPFTLAIVAALLAGALNGSRLVLIAIGAMLYVSIARGRLLGDSIHVHGGQLASLSALVNDCARCLDVAAPQVFVRDDVLVPISAVGVSEPYALVISSHWLAHLHDDELRFLIAREIAHIRAGHTRFSSILSVNGRENPAVSLVFGAYLRRTEYTADRVGLCCCGSLESAIKAIAIASFHNLGRSVDLRAVADQLRDLQSEPTLRAGEWLASSPYAARRIAALSAFAQTALARGWMTHFAASPVPLPRPHVESGSSVAFASWWRRVAAWAIDYSVILAIVPALVGPPPPSVAHVVDLTKAEQLVRVLIAGTIFSSTIFFLWLYCVVLVTTVGRTAGMMIVDVRVVRADFARLTIWDVLKRYTLAALSFLTVVPLVLWGFRRVQPYERLSGTRLVNANAVIEPQTAPAG